MEQDMSKTYSPQEIAVLSYLESYTDGADFMWLREHFLAIYEKELLAPTLTALSMKRLTTSRLHEKALWMEITGEGRMVLEQ
jgi:hypothetical protein